jgi:hypothetical protein
MEREWECLHQLIAKHRAERERLSRGLLALMRDEVTLSQDVILAQTGHEKPLRELLQEMRAQVSGG